MAENGKAALKELSMTSLVIWNISKILKDSPNLDLLDALKRTEQRMNQNIKNATSVNSVDRHLTCALLAWHRLGHQNVESLHKFYLTKKKERNDFKNQLEIQNGNKMSPRMSFIGYKDASIKTDSAFSVVGPVVKLPVDTKIIMRVDPPRSRKPSPTKNCRMASDKLEAACCNKPKCSERLSTLDSLTADLRARAEKLAMREARRVELLERAENAWSDLERGYQRRIALAAEKELNLARQLKNLIQERNGYQNISKKILEDLKKLGDCAEKDQQKYKQLEEKVCTLAMDKMAAGKEALAEDMALARQQCKMTQLESSLQVFCVIICWS